MVPARVEPPVCGAFTGIRFGANAPRTSAFSERAAWLWALTVTAGHRVSRFRAISGGLKVVDDGYLQEQRRRTNTAANNRGLSLPGGYELWLGRYVFFTYAGWGVHQPSAPGDGRVFQRYQLLYTVHKHWVVGIGLKAKLNVAEGFDIRTGPRF